MDDRRPLSAPATPPLPWPPPGLGRIQGDLPRLSGSLALGGGLVVGPLLLTLAARGPFELGGLLQDAWWVASLLVILGLIVLGHAYTGTFRLLRRTATAMGQGYGWITVGLAAADGNRDQGFLLQGGRWFSQLSARERRTLLAIRLVAAGATFLASLWLSLGFALAVLLAGAGRLAGMGGVAAFTLAPSAAGFGVALLLRAWDGSLARVARRRWHAQPWSSDLEGEEVRGWVERMEAGDREGRIGPGGTERRWIPSAGALLAPLAALLVTIPALVYVGTMGVTSLLSEISIPRFERTQRRAGALEALRSYRLEADPSISPQEGGELLQTLLYVGSTEELRAPVREPARRYPEPWLPEDPQGERSPLWFMAALDRVREGFTPEETAILERVAAHPAGAEWRRLARAPEVDVLAGRWVSPLPPGMTLVSAPLPRFSGLRQGAVAAQVAVAALEASRGRTAQAEERIREVISVGILLADSRVFLLDNMMGVAMANAGADALERLYRATGQEGRADELARGREAAARATERARPRTAPRAAQGLREMAALATDTTALPGLRWEMFVGIQTVTPCINLQRIVLGPGDEYRAWLEEARTALARWPSEEELFELGRSGHFGRTGPPARLPLALRPVGWVMGGKGQPESCGALLANMVTM